uniref:Putative glycosyltransferase n=1 Tax=viral metagenome TaxID=1070528 RepID=A0A6M3KXM4_9ZZZZ
MLNIAEISEFGISKENIIYISNETNLGFAKAVNQGLKASAKDAYKVILNNDTEVPPNWLEGLLRVAEDKSVGMVGALSSAFTEPHYYKNADRIKALKEIHRVYFHCCLIKPEVIETIGYLDEGFEMAYCEDDDYCQRALDMKFRLAYAYDVVVKHHHMASTKLLPNIGEIYEKNLARLVEKYPYLERKRKKIHIAVPTSAKVSPYFAKTIPNVLFDPRFAVTYDFYRQAPIDTNRNLIVKKFLETDAEILCMIDSDIVPPGNFLDTADLDLDVAGISCLNIMSGSDGINIVYCVADKTSDGDYKGLTAERIHGVQQVERIGMGCVFIKRKVLEAIEPPWFKQEYNEDFTLKTGEDYWFCDRCVEAGFKVWYDFTKICDHRKDNISLLEIMRMIQREKALAVIEYKNRDKSKGRGIIRPNRA